MKNRILFLSAAIYTTVSAIPFALADDVATTGDVFYADFPNPLKADSIPGVINSLFTWLLTIATAVVPIVVVIGAFYMLFSGGNPDKFKQGRQAILYAVIGFIIVLMAKGIVSIVESALGTK